MTVFFIKAWDGMQIGSGTFLRDRFAPVRTKVGGSRMAGEIPIFRGSEVTVPVIEANQIVDVQGDSSVVNQKRQQFASEPASATSPKSLLPVMKAPP